MSSAKQEMHVQLFESGNQYGEATVNNRHPQSADAFSVHEAAGVETLMFHSGCGGDFSSSNGCDNVLA